jgi:hypothetical protein
MTTRHDAVAYPEWPCFRKFFVAASGRRQAREAELGYTEVLDEGELGPCCKSRPSM